MLVHVYSFRFALTIATSFFMYVLFPLFIAILPVNTTYSQISVFGSSRSVNNSETKVHFNDGSTSFELEYKGTITLSDNDDDIIAISKGGYFEIEKKAFGSKRRILIEAERNGSLNKRYFIGRKEKEYIPAGEDWLSSILPEAIRSTGIGAEARVNKLYTDGGITAVLNYLDDVDSDHVRSIYYEELLTKDLNSNDVVRLLNDLESNMDSDHYISEILKDNDDIFLISPAATDAYINSVEAIDSDHYMSEILRNIIGNEDISDDQVNDLLDISEEINSDHYKSEVLRELIDERDLTKTNSMKLVELMDDINSDHYIVEVLTDLLDERDLDTEVLGVISLSLDNISSDHYLSEIIKSASRHDMDEKTFQSLLESTNENISSDHYHQESIQYLLDHQEDHIASNVGLLIDNISEINSDSYAANVITEVADMDDINDADLISLLMAIEDLNSDSYKAECLREIADHIDEDNNALYRAYRNAARTIRSESYYGQVMRAID